jgi:hypothetical protein
LRRFSKLEFWKNSGKGKPRDTWSFVLYNLHSKTSINQQEAELLQHGRYLEGNYLIAINELQTLQSKGVGKKTL